MKLSACIIALNEEGNLPRCLRSLEGLVDEIVVLDSGSTDRTAQVAAQFGARVHTHEWLGFTAMKNEAVRLASHDWVFSIDCDEELSPELKESLRRLKDGPEPARDRGFLVNRCVLYEGRWIRHGAWYPDRVLRIFNRQAGGFVGGHVHERVEGPARLEELAGDLWHYSYRDQADHLRRIDRYSDLWARQKHEDGKRAGPLAPWLHAAARFLVAYIVRRGFLDGAQGLTIARLNAREVFLKYRRLRALGRGR